MPHHVPVRGLRHDWQNFFHDRNNFAPRLALAYAPTRSRNLVIRDGMPSDRPAGVPRNTGQGPGFVGIDLRWYRELRLQSSAKERSPSLVLSLDAFNLPNRVNHQSFLGALTSPFFGKPVAAQPPRRVQVGIRFQF
jgi:hypothetical protein